MELDVLYLADLRFPGGTSTSLKYDLRACKQAGLRAGVVPLSSPVFARCQVPNSALLAEIEATGTVIVPQDETPKARVALLYHPSLLDKTVHVRAGFDADVFYVVVHQPTRDRRGRAYYRTEHWSGLAADLFSHDLRLLPVSDVVRKDLERHGFSHALHPANWTNLIDLEDFPLKQIGELNSPVRIGRHSRPSRDKLPSPKVALECYPQHPDYAHLMMGVPQDFLDAFDTLPWNWQIYAFSSRPVSGFLQSLDIYSYFHSDTWVEAFGYNVLEALATGLPCVVPHYMEETFSDACLYAEPANAQQTYDRLRSDRSLREEVSLRARAHVESRFGLDQFANKFEKIVEAPKTSSPGRVKHPRTSERPVVLSVTSNGVGLGHLTRQLAIAEALGPAVNVVFFSLSEAIEVARSMGYLAEFRPFHRRLQLDVDDWNSFFFQEMREALSHYKPSLVLFDGNVPYAGFIDAVDSYGKSCSAWIRRGMWRTPQPDSIAREGFFDAIIEPGELCEALDLGYSRVNPDNVTSVNPVLMTQPHQLLDKAAARRALDLPENATLCLVQLGAEANFNMSVPRELLFDFLDRHPDVIAVDVRSPLHLKEHSDIHERFLQRRLFPLGRYLKAFDFAVCAAGYNTFHENIAAALPTLFIPNSNPETDDQDSRALHGARAGWNLASTAEDPYEIETQLRKLLEPDIRQGLSLACARKTGCWDGAGQIARQLQIQARLPRSSQEPAP
ncbi:glycosyltransferase [uncultured Roseibium sp.]|uniref:glycosyltransferase n=1 Tax=uncultured Roseibium sp. TaxID=1936171 RepID=UPI00263879F1|nr:glycosyltransferase [uncultured Roseibium sp.]